MFMFLSNKGAHLLKIMGYGTAGLYAETMLTVPSATQTIAIIQIAAQVLIAVVTAWAAIRKALQEPIAPQQKTEGNV